MSGLKRAYATLLTSVGGGKCVPPVSDTGCRFALQANEADTDRATRLNIVHILVVEIFVKLSDEMSTAKPVQQRSLSAYHRDYRLRWSRGSVLAFSTQVRGFKPGRSRRIFRA